jgi:nitroimidazol reductase NimA-like FMN-containing flavoprotein (pyridoxamine 5'-phosphate oxidase superfamily)
MAPLEAHARRPTIPILVSEADDPDACGMLSRMSAPTKRTQVHRHPERGDYDRAVIDSILDEALICHVAFNDGDGAPRCLPTIHARVGDTIYLHGSTAARAWKALRAGAEVCIVATIVDGLVMARSAFNHSMNYRSVVVFGIAREVTDEEELHTAAAAITSHVAPGREDEARMPTPAEYKQTLLLAVPLEEASAKVRTGPPKDDEEDKALPIWAGVLPLVTRPGDPETAPDLHDGIDVPPSVTGYHRPGGQ